MKTLTIRESGRPLGLTDLVELEKELGARLPSEYRRFLCKHNGGIPDPDVIDIEGLPESPSDVQVLFGTDEDESCRLGWHRREVPNSLPSGVLPVACDSGGNLYCLALTGRDAGKITYLDMGMDSTYDEYFVANSFQAFLQKIRALEH